MGDSILITGTSALAVSTDNGQTESFVKGRFTIAAGQALEVQHRCETTNGAGFGIEFNLAGISEVYTIAEFWKVG